MKYFVGIGSVKNCFEYFVKDCDSMNVAQIISLCRKKYLSLPRLSLGTRLTLSIGLIITVTSFINEAC